MIKDKLKGQLKEEPLVSTRGSDLYFSSLVNCYVTNLYTLRGVPSFKTIHNIPSSDVITFDDFILFRSGNLLYRYPNELLFTFTSDFSLSYTIINDTLYISNGHQLVSYDGNIINEIPSGDIDDFHAYLPAGFPIEHDKGRLLAVKGNNIYFSNIWDYTIVDKRTNLLSLDSKVVLLCSVPEGLIIGTDKDVSLYSYVGDFMVGRLSKLYDSPARSINYIFFNGKFLFMCEEGLVQYPEVKCLTRNKHNPITNYCRLYLLSLSYAELIEVVWL